MNKLIYGMFSIAMFATFDLPDANANDLTGDEIKTLLSGKTVYSYHERKEFNILTYYAPDSSLKMLRKDDIWPGNWRTDNKGNICITLKDPYSGMEKREHCNLIAKDGSIYKKYKVKENGTRVHLITYTKFVDGNEKAM